MEQRGKEFYMKQPVTFAICGLGNRGQEAYACFQKKHPEKMKIVAIADPDSERRQLAQNEYNVPAKMCFTDAESLLTQPKLAEVLIIATQDRQHVAQAIPALEKGYHILLEKPISPNLSECILLRETAHKYNRMVIVCHVLRYTDFYQTIKRLLQEGAVGTIQSMDAVENIAYWHYAHSFVRGNWRDSEQSSPVILAKSCHDMDMIRWLMGQPCKTISSFGSLGWFMESHAPEGAALRCLDGCKAKNDCPYDAEKIYITNEQSGFLSGNREWPCSVLCNSPTEEKLYEALQTGPYGRCVYHCDNNVADHQVVNMNFMDGATASFTMSAFTKGCYRTIKIMGSHGEISGNMSTNLIKVRSFNRPAETIDLGQSRDRFSGHGGGDEKMMDYLCSLAAGDYQESLTSIDVSVESHIMALAAEHSRIHNGINIDLDDFS